MRYSPWQQPQAGIGCISAHTGFIEDITGETIQFPINGSLALSFDPVRYLLLIKTHMFFDRGT